MKVLRSLSIFIAAISLNAAIPGVTTDQTDELHTIVMIDFGNIQWHRDGEMTRLIAEHSNSTYYTDNHEAIQQITIPVAIKNNALPDIRYQILNEINLDFPISDPQKIPAILSQSELKSFRDQQFIRLNIQPLISTNRAALKVRIEISFTHENRPETAETTYRNYFVNNSIITQNQPKPSIKSVSKTASFPEGSWYEIKITEKGIYKISGADLIRAGINVTSLQPGQIRLYGSSTAGHPYTAIIPVPFKNLVEIPLLTLTQKNDLWSDNDAFLFYGQGASSWDYSENSPALTGAFYNTNPYETINHYWLLITSAVTDEPARMSTYNASGATETVSEHIGRFHHENDESNLIQGGIWWYGESFSGTNATRNISFSLPDLAKTSEQSAFIRIGAAGASVGSIDHEHTFNFFLYNQTLSIPIYVINYARSVKTLQIPLSYLSTINQLTVSYTGSSAANKAFFDFVSVLYPSVNSAAENELDLWYPELSNPSTISYSGFSTAPIYLFDISDPLTPTYRVLTASSGSFDAVSSENPLEFYLLDESHFKSTESLTAVPEFSPDASEHIINQADLVIIYHPDFENAARRLAAHKESRPLNPLTTLTISIEDVMNQYSGGNYDPYSVRNFLYDLYHHSPSPAPKYVIFFGDGSYDYRNISGKANNFIPQFEISAGDVHNTRNTDDPFLYLSGGNDLTIDMAAGRFPVNNSEEADNLVQKIIDYENRSHAGSWQSNISLIADDPTDPDDNWPYFIENTEFEIKPTMPGAATFNKIYLTEFPELYDASIQALGRIGARDAILNALENGTVLMNYIGHGSPLVWAQEYVFVKDRDLPAVNTGGRFPLIVAATCDWGRSDYLDIQSMAEALVTLEDNGAIGTIATTRAVYDSYNMDFLQNLYPTLFPNAPQNSDSPMLGDAYLYAKIFTSSYLNTSKFQLLGDPTLYLAFPQNSGSITAISSDTLKALDHVTISGTVSIPSELSHLNHQFSGKVQLYDSELQVTREYKYYQTNAWKTGTVTYMLPGSKLFDGNVTIDENQFTAQFIIPKDIQYNGVNGLLRLQYQNSDNTIEGILYQDKLVIQGSSDSVQTDFDGPVISVSVEGYNFVSGDAVSDTSTLVISFSDENGINITGSTGHDISLKIGARTLESITGNFEYDADSFQSGKIYLTTGDYFSEGENEFTIEAFDNYNNFSSIDGSITIIDAVNEILFGVVNFPNPFSRSTSFTFQSALDGEAEIIVYTMSGKPVIQLKDLIVNNGFNSYFWDGLNQYGDALAAGFYFYTIGFRSGDIRFHATEKIVKLP